MCRECGTHLCVRELRAALASADVRVCSVQTCKLALMDKKDSVVYFTSYHSFFCILAPATPPLLFTLPYSHSSNFWSVTNGIYRLYVSWERLSLILKETVYVSLPEIDLPFSRGKCTGREEAVAREILGGITPHSDLEMIRGSISHCRNLICVD